MQTWYPNATKYLGHDAGSFYPNYNFKGVLHTTEGSTASGAISAYKKNNSWSHFTVDKDGKVFQHIPLDKSARSLENHSGGVETNRGKAIQIEVVGKAAEVNWPQAQVDAMRSLMRWIESQTGIKPYGPVFGSGEQYGFFNPLEFSGSYWTTFNGWCGHQHVPENKHWDPGAINLNNLLPPKEAKPMYDPPFDIPGGVAAHLMAPNGGVWVFGSLGHVYAFGCPHYGQPAGQSYWGDRKVAYARPFGQGYTIVPTNSDQEHYDYA